ncbi:MAG: metallophosphoesterase family protein [Bacteroidales bacterium]|nr:metallophosphoesterase family protein [Bacteroidales bacterium]
MACLKEHGPRWWRGEGAIERLRQELEQHDNFAGIATAHGANRNTLSKAWNDLGGECLTSGPKSRPIEPSASAPDDSWLLIALKKAGDAASVDELADVADVSPRRVREALERLGHEGFRVAETDDARVVIERTPRPSEDTHELLFAGEVYRFGVVSDTHLCSKHCRLEELHIAYDYLEAHGIETVYHPGDIGAGRGIYKGQDHELTHFTYEEQRAYIVENYPRREGITTRIISGNHDCEGDFGRAGADLCHGVANGREDVIWDGMYSASYTLPQGTRVDIRHPMGGKAYADSYIPKRFAESFEGGDKPNVLIFGHWHTAFYQPIRNIQVMCAGTFEGGGNSLGQRRPLGAPAVGFWMVEMRVADDGSVVEFDPKWRPFYRGRMVA